MKKSNHYYYGWMMVAIMSSAILLLLFNTMPMLMKITMTANRKKPLLLDEMGELLRVQPLPESESQAHAYHVSSTSRRRRRHTRQPLPEPDLNGYVSYMPHSGFNNQRQALENGLLVAALLNRTLILPPLYLGHSGVLAWREFPLLQLSLRQVETANYNRVFFSDYIESYLLEFLSSNASLAVVPFSALFNLSALGVRTISVADFVDLHLIHRPTDILQIRDNERYSYAIVDHLPGGDVRFLFDNSHNDMPLQAIKPTSDDASADQWFLVNMTLCRIPQQQPQSDQQSEDQYAIETTSGFYWRSDEQHSVHIRQLHHRLHQTHSPSSDHFNYTLYPCTQRDFEHALKPIPLSKEPTVFDTGRSKLAQINLRKYGHIINLAAGVPSYERHSEKPLLLQFGSMFGQSRLQLFLKHNQDRLMDLRSRFQITNPRLNAITDAIVSQFTTLPTRDFIALHIRAGDGEFHARLNDTIQVMVAQLRELRANGTIPAQTPFYIATDHPNPRSHPTFAPLTNLIGPFHLMTDFSHLLQHHLSAFDTDRLQALHPDHLTSDWESEMTLLLDQVDAVLSEFGVTYPSTHATKDVVERHYRTLSQYLLSTKRHFTQLSSPSDPTGGMGDDEGNPFRNVNVYGRLWIPFVEQLVCSRARGVIGTTGSTFSSYIETLHRARWSAGQDGDGSVSKRSFFSYA